MADQAFPDGDLAHPDQPNAYGPVQYPVRSSTIGLVRGRGAERDDDDDDKTRR